MPSPTQDRQKTVRRKVNPATSPIEELLAHLATDPASGLSPKEAERRLGAASTAETPLYTTTQGSFSHYLGRALREPALWLLLAVSIIALFFDRVPLGLVCLLLGGGHAVLCAYLAHRAARIDATMQINDAPLTRVLRSRRVFRVSANHVVRGDILLLYPGDLVPADCRLLRTEGFAVRERAIDADPGRPTHRLDKDASATPESGGSYRLSPANMAFAGGVVESGFAIAVAVATGSRTHLGGLVGGVKPAHPGTQPRLWKTVARALSIFNLALIALLLPLVAIGIFSLGDDYEFLDIFLSALALASLALTEHILIKGRFVTATVRRAAATDRDRDNAATVKTSADLERLTTVTDLLLVGTAALHDGSAHPETLTVGDTTYRCDEPEADSAARTAAELIYLCHYGHAHLPTATPAAASDLTTLLPALITWAEVDTEALLVRIKDLRAEADGISGVFPTRAGNHRVTLRLTDDADALNAPPSAVSTPYARAMADARRAGSRALLLITEDEDGLRPRAVLSYAPHTCRKTAGAIRGMESAGIRVTAFLSDATDENTRLLTECGLTDNHPSIVLSPDAPTLELMNDGCRAFESATPAAVAETIRALRAAGRTVAVFSVEAGHVSLLDAADVAITCGPSLYAIAEEGRPLHIPEDDLAITTAAPSGPDGLPDSAIATDLGRRRADILVNRTTETGGGVCAIRRALLAADHAKATVDRAFRFLLLSEAARLAAAILSFCLGLAPAAAPALLFSLCIDTLVVLAVAHLPLGASPAPRRSFADGLDRPWLTQRPRLIITAVSAALPWLVAFVAALLDTDFGADLTYLGLLCTVGLQLAILRMDSLPRRDRTAFLTSFAIVLAYVASLALALGAGLGLLWTLAIPLVSPVAYMVLVAIFDRNKA